MSLKKFLDGNHVIVRLIDPIKTFDIEGGLKHCKHGIGQTEIPNLSLFEINPYVNKPKEKAIETRLQKL